MPGRKSCKGRTEVVGGSEASAACSYLWGCVRGAFCLCLAAYESIMVIVADVAYDHSREPYRHANMNNHNRESALSDDWGASCAILP